jgi:hypothetical protein
MKSVFKTIFLFLFLTCSYIKSYAEYDDFRHAVTSKCIAYINKDKKTINPIKGLYSGKKLKDLKDFYKPIKQDKIIEDIYFHTVKISSEKDIKEQANGFIELALKSVNEKILVKTDDYSKLKEDLGDIKNDFIVEQTDRFESSTKSESNGNTSITPLTAQDTQKDKLDIKTDNLEGNSKESNVLNYLFFLISIIGIGAVYILLNKKIKSLEDKINTKATVLNQANGFDSIKYKEEIKSELSKLIDSKIVEAEINQKQELKTKQSPEIKKEVIIKEEPVKQPEPVNKPQRMYVRTAEYENAFNVNSLKEIADTQSVFVININGDIADFEINPSSDAQSLAISNFEFYFSKICNFSELPNSNTKKIFTKTPGKLKLIGNKWEVISKADITIS